MTGPVMLIVLDGFGIGEGGEGDATALAHTPFLENARSSGPAARLETSGRAVGLPDGQMGNSEVGHMTMGSGRVIDQDITRISKALRSDGVAANPVLRDAYEAAAHPDATLHLMGLVSDGGVHSHQEHLIALLEECRRRGVRPMVHAFLDGRDTPPRSGLGYVQEIEPAVAAAGGRIATVSGRYYAMDRDNRWDRVGRAYAALVEHRGVEAADAESAIRDAYARDEGDEFVQPSVIEGGEPIRDGDVVLFFNFRADRARELTNAITSVCPDRFEGKLDRKTVVRPSRFICFTEYDREYGLPIAFPTQMPEHILGEILAEAGLPQLRIAETEKYAHVTFFFNCGREVPFAGEERVLIPSPRDVPTYDHKPEMSAIEVTDTLLARLEQDEFAFVLLNFANPDMVGHTGILPAAVKAVETVDACLARICEAVVARGGVVLITSDHGNCEQMIDPSDGSPHTAHTTNPVPVLYVGEDAAERKLRDGTLADLAPTLLDLLGLPLPKEMTGKTLLRR